MIHLCHRGRGGLLLRVFLVLLSLLLALGDTREPVEEQSAAEVEDDEHPEDAKVLPSVI